tara:strand:- start:11680 stop:11895 length:216 start_codon:yes stop_codon:yes gene_type:complete
MTTHTSLVDCDIQMENSLRTTMFKPKRSVGEKILIKWGELEILFTIVEISGNKARLSFEGPESVLYVDIPC